MINRNPRDGYSRLSFLKARSQTRKLLEEEKRRKKKKKKKKETNARERLWPIVLIATRQV